MSAARSVQKLKAEIREAASVTETEKLRMFELMQSNYESVSDADFRRDLENKTHVILLRDCESGEIQGFSTMLAREVEGHAGRYYAVFSGDTIVQKQYWGQRALQKAFTRFMIRRKLEKPWRPLYWFLISKGYKTYLLLANNFWKHYPRFERETPQREQSVMDEFYSRLFSERYQPESGLVVFGQGSCRLKGTVAPITPEMRARNPRIDYFERRNPRWEMGEELACMGEIDLLNPIFYLGKAMLRTIRPRHSHPGAPRP